MNFIATINPLRLPTADELAVRHLDEARRDLLIAQAVKEEADSSVEKLTKRVARLTVATNKSKRV